MAIPKFCVELCMVSEKSPLAASNDSQMSSQQQMEFAQLEVDKIREKQEAILQVTVTGARACVH